MVLLQLKDPLELFLKRRDFFQLWVSILSRYHLCCLKRYKNPFQCLSQDLETGCLKLEVVKFLGVQIFKVDHNILIFQP